MGAINDDDKFVSFYESPILNRRGVKTKSSPQQDRPEAVEDDFQLVVRKQPPTGVKTSLLPKKTDPRRWEYDHAVIQ